MTALILVAMLLMSIGWSQFQPEPATGSRWLYGVVLFVTFAAAGGIGALLGFLFGLPRSRLTEQLSATEPATAPAAPTTPAGRHYLANSNLIKVSDWLTTIVIGLTLVNLTRVAPAGRSLGDALREPLGGTAAAEVVGLAIVVFGALCGFMLMYLYVSIRVRALLEDSENAPLPMPTFTDLTVTQAKRLAAELGIVIDVPSTARADDVLTSQTPAAGVMVHAEKKVYAST